MGCTLAMQSAWQGGGGAPRGVFCFFLHPHPSLPPPPPPNLPSPKLSTLLFSYCLRRAHTTHRVHALSDSSLLYTEAVTVAAALVYLVVKYCTRRTFIVLGTALRAPTALGWLARLFGGSSGDFPHEIIITPASEGTGVAVDAEGLVGSLCDRMREAKDAEEQRKKLV